MNLMKDNVWHNATEGDLPRAGRHVLVITHFNQWDIGHLLKEEKGWAGLHEAFPDVTWWHPLPFTTDPHWINVHTRLPEEGVHVMIQDRGRKIDVGYYQGQLFHSGTRLHRNIISWMPLPAKPEETD